MKDVKLKILLFPVSPYENILFVFRYFYHHINLLLMQKKPDSYSFYTVNADEIQVQRLARI